MSGSNPLSRLKTQISAAETPGVQSLLTLAVFVVVVGGLSLAKDVLIPLTLAVLLSFVLAPLVSLLRRAKLPRVPAVVLAVLLALGVLLGLGGTIGAQIADLTADAPRYASTIQRKLEAVQGYTVGRLSELTNRLGRQTEYSGAAVPGAPAGPAVAPGTPDAPKPTLVEVRQPEPGPLEVAQRVLTPVLAPLAETFIILIVSIFILLQQEDLRDRIIRLFGSGDLHRTTAAMDDAAARLSKYFLTQLALNTMFGVVVGIGLLLIGVPNALLWAIVGGLFRFVPYVGAVAAVVPPLLMAAAVDPGWTMVISVALLFVVIEPVWGQVVEPLVYGHSTGLSPVSVVIAAIFWGWLWGPVGLILSMPLTLCLVVMGRHIDRLQFIDVLLGDRPALTPAESFYQRILAGDADEALDQAEILLRDRPLSAYYDEVALRGLALAANDSLRGVLTDAQLQNIQDATDGVVLDLASHDDVMPTAKKDPSTPPMPGTAMPTPPPSVDAAVENLSPEWAGVAPILCVAGRGPLDEAAGAMLAQILGKHGLRARVVSQSASSRGHIEALDVSGVAMVCVSYLEASGSPSALRYLMRRMRQRLPGVPVLVGLWQADASVLADERLRTAIGADHYVTTLHAAVEECVAAAKATQGARAAETVPA